jgi:hypothetical protein
MLGPRSRWRHPELGAVQPGEGSRVGASRDDLPVCARDLSLRQKAAPLKMTPGE